MLLVTYLPVKKSSFKHPLFFCTSFEHPGGRGVIGKRKKMGKTGFCLSFYDIIILGWITLGNLITELTFLMLPLIDCSVRPKKISRWKGDMSSSLKVAKSVQQKSSSTTRVISLTLAIQTPSGTAFFRCPFKNNIFSVGPTVGSLCRIDLATFTHDYKRVVGVDSAGQERDSTTCVICLSGAEHPT
jgi:hypothetical protein